ncbi:MAG: divalent-cation tolerance protein CutA [Gammaproteobacteria bacterium]|nr:divalent-cation tolerance protein CutA [Gammaproteobacteria bacterium]
MTIRQTNTGVHIVLTTCPNRDTAQTLAKTLVEQNLAACVNIIDGVRSVYKWNGGIQDDAELLLLIKSPVEHFPVLRDRLLELHPYELPEIVTVPVTDGLAGYLDWILNSK